MTGITVTDNTFFPVGSENLLVPIGVIFDWSRQVS
jgi:hypothetical protein